MRTPWYLLCVTCVACGGPNLDLVESQCASWVASGNGPVVPAGHCAKSFSVEDEQLVSASSDVCESVHEGATCLVLFPGETPYYAHSRLSSAADRAYELVPLDPAGSCPLVCE